MTTTTTTLNLPALSFGTAITTGGDALQARSLAEVFALITTDPGLKTTTDRLRKLALLDREAARTLKTRLPYVVGSAFGGVGETALRRTDAFAEARYFVLDVDHCKHLDGAVPDAVRQDASVALAFVSPSGEGVKVLFRLLDACTDPKAFSAAYRNFASDFGTRHRWAQGLDLRTCDVTRACFLAHDPAAYYNPDAFPVDWRAWLLADDDGLFADGLPTPTNGVAMSGRATGGEPAQPATRKPLAERPIDPVAYDAVRQQINPKAPVRREKQVTVPEELYAVEPVLRQLCQHLNWELRTVEKLNYGLKFGIRHGLRSAEVNVYWGKRGYSLVRSPKTGTDPALNDLLYQHLFGLLFPESVTEGVPVVVSVN